jgi:hypothetical protein
MFHTTGTGLMSVKNERCVHCTCAIYAQIAVHSLNRATTRAIESITRVLYVRHCK